MKTLTRKRAWKKIKRAFQIHYTSRAYEDGPAGFNTATAGLCRAVDVLYGAGELRPSIVSEMSKDIRQVKPATHNPIALWYWSIDAAGAKSRVRAINKILKKL